MAGRRGRPVAPIVLTEDERDTLMRWGRRHTSLQALAMRCRIVLACAAGGRNRQVATEAGVYENTVGKWQRRFAAVGLEGLSDAPRPGAPRTVGDEVVEAVVVDTLETAPKDATHWSTRGRWRPSTGSRVRRSRWRAFGLKPWVQDGFKISPDLKNITHWRGL